MAAWTCLCAALSALALVWAGAAEAQSPLELVRERVRASDAEGALALIAKLPPELAAEPGVRYLAARLYERQDKFREALASLPREGERLPPRIVRDVAERRARLLARTGRCSEARWMLAVLAQRDGPDAELSQRASDCAREQGDAALALVLLRAVRGRAGQRFAVRFSLAKLLVQTGDAAGAIRELRELYVETPEHSRNGEVAALLETLRPNLQLSTEERLTRAEHWLEAHRHAEALQELQSLEPESRALRARLAHVRGLILFRTRENYDEASRLLAEAEALGGQVHAEDAFMAAQALARANKDAQAVRAYRAFAKRYPRHRKRFEALHDAAWLELRHDLRGGEANMRKVMRDAERRRDREAVTAASWELAFHAFAHDRCDKALPLFESYAKTSDVAMIKARGLYWAGRCALASKKRARGIELLREALRVEPLHYYSLLARSRLVSVGVDPGPPFDVTEQEVRRAAETAPAAEPLELPADVEFYLRLGLREDALAALEAQERSVRDGMASDSLVALSEAYHALSEYSRPYHLAERERDDVLLEAPVGLARPVWDALFPRPYLEAARHAAEQAEVPEALLYAIMRKESAFNPNVVSYADAIGLMQLLESTAKATATTLAWTNFDRSLLYEPNINLLLGAHLVGALLERYRGQAVPAIAAYNAGEHRVDPWLSRGARAGSSLELDRFVEDIPIDQTRNYVRRVIGNWARYRYLEDPVGWPLDLPLKLTVRGRKGRSR